MNPYSGKNFVEFLHVLFSRIYLLVSGKLGLENLVSDEIQIGVLVLVAVSAALIGAFLVLKKMTMMANALSHTILLGMVVSYLMIRMFIVSSDFLDTIPLSLWIGASFLTGILTTMSIQALIKAFRLSEDASIGLVFTMFFNSSATTTNPFPYCPALAVSTVAYKVGILVCYVLPSITLPSVMSAIFFHPPSNMHNSISG